MQAATAGESSLALADGIARLVLVDHRVHGAFRDDLDRLGLETSLTEAELLPPGMTQFDSQLGFAVRRWCGPVLDLEPHVSPDAYVARRQELGTREVTRRLLRASGVGAVPFDTGHAPERLLSNADMSELSGATVAEVVRLEQAGRAPSPWRPPVAARHDALGGERRLVTPRRTPRRRADRTRPRRPPLPPGLRSQAAAGPGKWQATRWPGASSSSTGTSVAQSGCARGQRLRKTQPDGGA